MERKKHPFGIRYGVAIGVVALAVFARSILYSWGGDDAPRYIPYYPAIIFITLYAGLWPGLLSVVFLSSVAIYWVEPVGSFTIKSQVAFVGYVIFVLTNFLMVWICEKMHRATIRAAKAEAAASILETVNAQAAALKESEERYRAIFETAVDAIVTIDEKGIIQSINPAGEQLFGYRAEELTGKNVKCLMPSPDHERHDQYLRNYLETGVKKIIGIGRDVMARRKDGSVFPVRLAVSEMWVGNRRIFTGQLLDMTERKKTEQGLEEAKDAAQAVNALKDQFLATLSHELRTPLTPALMVIAAREADPDLDGELREDLATARRNLELEARLIDDLLDLNRVVRGKIQLSLKPRSAHSLIQRALAVCRADFEAKGISVQLDLKAGKCFTDADSGRLLQVFWNLLRNAAKFTPRGGSVTVRSENAEPGWVRVEIADTGIGIAPEKIGRLFVPFEQGDSQITRQFGGMGLGLAISKALVDLHHGRIEARSEGEGKGTSFTLELPLTKVENPPEEGEPQAARTAGAGPRGREIKILLVEDHLDTLRILSRLLESQGIVVTAAQTRASALGIAQAAYGSGGMFDLVISDLGLPDGDGREMMARLRDDYGLSGIALSGYGMEEDMEKSRAAGFSEHLIKPVKIAELLQAIARVAGGQEER